MEILLFLLYFTVHLSDHLGKTVFNDLPQYQGTWITDVQEMEEST